MTAVAGTTAQQDVNLVLAAFDPGPFGQPTEPELAWPVRRSTLFEAECHLEDAATIFEHLDERGFCDDLEELIGRVKERLAAKQEHDDKEEAA